MPRSVSSGMAAMSSASRVSFLGASARVRLTRVAGALFGGWWGGEGANTGEKESLGGGGHQGARPPRRAATLLESCWEQMASTSVKKYSLVGASTRGSRPSSSADITGSDAVRWS